MKKEAVEKIDVPCPMCKNPLIAKSKNRYILGCNHCSITFAVGEIVEQEENDFCIFANECVIFDPFTEKRRTRIFCREYKSFNSPDFCKRSCEYRTPQSASS